MVVFQLWLVVKIRGKYHYYKIGYPGAKVSNKHADDKNFKISSALEILVLCVPIILAFLTSEENYKTFLCRAVLK